MSPPLGSPLKIDQVNHTSRIHGSLRLDAIIGSAQDINAAKLPTRFSANVVAKNANQGKDVEFKGFSSQSPWRQRGRSGTRRE